MANQVSTCYHSSDCSFGNSFPACAHPLQLQQCDSPCASLCDLVSLVHTVSVWSILHTLARPSLDLPDRFPWLPMLLQWQAWPQVSRNWGLIFYFPMGWQASGVFGSKSKCLSLCSQTHIPGITTDHQNVRGGDFSQWRLRQTLAGCHSPISVMCPCWPGVKGRPQRQSFVPYECPPTHFRKQLVWPRLWSTDYISGLQSPFPQGFQIC